jgi:hypothetical protein
VPVDLMWSLSWRAGRRRDGADVPAGAILGPGGRALHLGGLCFAERTRHSGVQPVCVRGERSDVLSGPKWAECYRIGLVCGECVRVRH